MRRKDVNQIKIGGLLSYLQTGLNAIITLVYTPIMIRLLGSSEYGLYNTVSSVISIIALLNLGFSSTYIRFYTRYDAVHDKQSVGKLNGMFLCIFAGIAAAAAVCGIFLSNHLFVVFSEGLTEAEYATAKILLLILTGNLTITLVGSTFTCIITANEQFVLLKLIGLIRLVVSPLITIPLMLAGYGSVGVVVTTTICSCIAEGIHIWYVFFVLKAKFDFSGFNGEVFRAVCSFTVLIAIHLIVDQINWNVDKILLGRFKGTESVALYSVGYSLYSHFMTIGLTMVGLFTPRVHKIVSNFQNDKHQLMQNLTGLFTTLGRIQFFILAPIAVGFLFWGKPFLGFWVGPEYIDAYYVALLLMIPGSVDIIQNIGIEIQRALGLHGFRAAIYAVMAVINVLISAVLCQKYGAVGCAVGTAISLILVQGIIMNVYYYKRCYLDIPAFWKSIFSVGKGLILPVCFGLVMCNLKNCYTIVELLVCLSCFVLIYIVSMFWLGMTSEERKTVNTIWKNRR